MSGRTLRYGLIIISFVGVFVLILAGTIAYRMGLFDPNRGHGNAEPITTANLNGSGPGSLVSAETMPSLSRQIPAAEVRTARIVYRSTEGDTEAPTEVS